MVVFSQVTSTVLVFNCLGKTFKLENVQLFNFVLVNCEQTCLIQLPAHRTIPNTNVMKNILTTVKL